MSVHLVGGGSTEGYDGEVFRGFLVEATARGDRSPRIAVLVVSIDDDAAKVSEGSWSRQLLRAGECTPIVTAIVEGELFESSVLSDIDGLLIAGGLTPAYLDAVTPLVDEIRLLVGDGLPYLGFSAGAAIAAEAAIIGGWKIDDIPVCAEDAGEDLEHVTIAEGLGLVELAIDVHAAQWGTLARLVAATEAGLVEGGVAIDEFTALVISDDAIHVVGRGNAWSVSQHDDGVLVTTILP